jgi:hypothetical protein
LALGARCCGSAAGCASLELRDAAIRPAEGRSVAAEALRTDVFLGDGGFAQRLLHRLDHRRRTGDQVGERIQFAVEVVAQKVAPRSFGEVTAVMCRRSPFSSW